MEPLYDIIVCYCNGFVMIPEKVIKKGLFLEEAKDALPDYSADYKGQITAKMGQYLIMMAKQGEYQIKKR